MTEDILDDAALGEVSAEAFRAYVRLLAMLNRMRSEDGKISLDRRGICFVAARTRVDYAEASLSQLEARSLLTMTKVGPRYDLAVSKWPEIQGLGLHSDSGTDTDTDIKKKRAHSAPPPPRNQKPRKPKAKEPDPRAIEAWPGIRAAFAEHGKQVGEQVGVDRAALLAKRLDEGHTPEDLVMAVHGYVRGHGGLEPQDGFDPSRYFRPQTIFKADGF